MSEYILRKGPARMGPLANLITTLQSLKDDCEFIVTVEKYDRGGRHRSIEQNRLQHLWHHEAATALKDEAAEDKRAYCKLHFGVPILRAESDEFRAQYDAIIRPLPYEKKLELMKAPIDFPVTRLMTTEQTTRFLDAVADHYRSLGVRLTMPEAA